MRISHTHKRTTRAIGYTRTEQLGASADLHLERGTRFILQCRWVDKLLDRGLSVVQYGMVTW